MRKSFANLFAIFLAGMSSLVQAEIPQRELCHKPSAEVFASNISAQDERIHITADEATSTQEQQYEARGHVQVETRNHYFEADQTLYDAQSSRINATGTVRYHQSGLTLESSDLSLDLNNQTGEATETHYRLAEQGSNGTAAKIGFSENKISLHGATYSTCDDGNKEWQLSAKSIVLDTANNSGVARNTTLDIVGIPVLYLPYLSFPLKGRKSGFLAPNPRYSSSDGFDIKVPYYLNLAPNYDMTLTPRWITSRGGQLSSEFRYLQANNNGEWGVEWLPDDLKAEKNRYFASVQHEHRLAKNTFFDIKLAHASDVNYFSDLGATLNTVNQTQLPRQVLAGTQGKHWRLTALMHDFQMLDGNPEPFKRLPQVNFSYQNYSQLFQWKSNLEYSHFYMTSDNSVQRLVIEPEFGIDWRTPYAFFTPAVMLHAKAYQLKIDKASQKTFSNFQLKTDAGFIFEKVGDKFIQTMEPSLHYQFAPSRSQDSLPLIDSALMDESFQTLFLTNRYSGFDRLGDENRLSWTVATRRLGYDGQEKASLALGQAYYLSDHQITLPGEQNINNGDMLNAVRTRAAITRNLSLNAELVHYSFENQLRKSSVNLRYLQNQAQTVIGYRYRNNLLEQMSASGIIPVTSRWRFAGRWVYSVRDSQTQEALAGIEYNDCCWSVRFVTRAHSPDEDQQLKTSVGIQVELTGLTRIGSSLDKEFSNEIFGIQ